MQIHADEKFMRLSKPQPNGRDLFLHFLIGPSTKIIPGLYRAGEAGLAEELDWSLKGFRESFTEVSREDLVKADWEARVVWIPNAIKHNRPANPNVVKSWADTWAEIPECNLKLEAYQTLKSFLESLGESFAKAFTERCRKPFGNPLAKQEQDQEQDQEQERDGTPQPRSAKEKIKAFDVWKRWEQEAGRVDGDFSYQQKHCESVAKTCNQFPEPLAVLDKATKAYHRAKKKPKVSFFAADIGDYLPKTTKPHIQPLTPEEAYLASQGGANEK